MFDDDDESEYEYSAVVPVTSPYVTVALRDADDTDVSQSSGDDMDICQSCSDYGADSARNSTSTPSPGPLYSGHLVSFNYTQLKVKHHEQLRAEDDFKISQAEFASLYHGGSVSSALASLACVVAAGLYGTVAVDGKLVGEHALLATRDQAAGWNPLPDVLLDAKPTFLLSYYPVWELLVLNWENRKAYYFGPEWNGAYHVLDSESIVNMLLGIDTDYMDDRPTWWQLHYPPHYTASSTGPDAMLVMQLVLSVASGNDWGQPVAAGRHMHQILSKYVSM